MVTFYGDVISDLWTRYSGPTRYYHNITHVNEVLSEVDRLGGLDERTMSHVRWAAWFHDVEGTEEASAEFARERLTAAGMDQASIDEVVRLVLITKPHVAPDDDPAGDLICDGDLWILSAPDDRYDEYAGDVRKEYAKYDDVTFGNGRMKVLLNLLGRANKSALYRFGLDDDRADRHQRATYNMQRELLGLVGGRKGPASKYQVVDEYFGGYEHLLMPWPDERPPE